MKIDFYISSLSGGGAEKVLITLAENFAKKNAEVSIYSLEKRPQFYQVPSIVKLDKISQNNKKLNDYHSIRNRLKERKSDVVISFLSRCNILVLLASLRQKQKVVVCDRNNPLKEHSKIVFWLSCLIYSLADGIVVQTNQIKSYYPSYLQKKIIVLENPLDTEKLEAQCTGQNIEKDNVIISMGRLEPQKDYDTLIKAFSRIQHCWPDWKLHIWGIGNQESHLQELINELNLSEKVFLCGRTETPFLEMKKAKILVLSSNYEGFPNVLCEGMYAGLPCVSSDCVSGPRELIQDGVNGYLFEIGNIDQLCDKLTLLLQSDEMRDCLGSAAHNTAERLKLDRICEKWYDYVCHIVGETNK